MSEKPSTVKMVLAIGLALLIAILAASGASSYYGSRKMGQDLLLDSENQSNSFYHLIWNFEYDYEVILDPAHIAQPLFGGGKLGFKTVEDTYFVLNTYLKRIHSHTNSIFNLTCNTFGEAGSLILYLKQDDKLFISEPIVLNAGKQQHSIDMKRLKFYRSEAKDEPLVWGVDFEWLNGVRLDWDFPSGSAIEVEKAEFPTTILLNYHSSHLNDYSSKENVIFDREKGKLALKETAQTGFIQSKPIGLGDFRRFLDLSVYGQEGQIKKEIRLGINDGKGFVWEEWVEIENDQDLSAITPLPYLQVKFTLNRSEQLSPSFAGFNFRYMDLSPPGAGSLVYGSSHIPGFNSILTNPPPRTSWIRLEAWLPRFEERLNISLGNNLSIICRVSLINFTPNEILGMIRKYRTRILVWELLDTERQGAPHYTDLFEKMRLANPMVMVFPAKVNHDYFQDLANSGIYHFTGQQGAPAEMLNRGFWFFFTVIIVILLVIIGLGPIIGYNFNFGSKELKALALGILATAAILIPLFYLTRFSGLTLPRDLPQIQIAFGRFAISAFLQEFIKSLMLLLPVYYLSKSGLKENTAWHASILATSILFGLTHLGYPGFSSWEVFCFILVVTVSAIITGYVFKQTRSLPVVYVIHLLSNVFMSTMTEIGTRI